MTGPRSAKCSTSATSMSARCCLTPILVDAEPAVGKATPWEVLLRAGFQFLGEWTQGPASAIKLDAKAPAEPGVYAFVLDDVVAYVGLTNGTLRTCLDQYRRGHAQQRTRARVNKLISKTLADGKRVKVVGA